MRKRLGAGGFTLVEVMITVAILGILAAVAVPSFKAMMPRVRLSSATQTLANSLAMARMNAIARSVDGEAVIDKDANDYTLAKAIGGVPYVRTALGSSVVIESMSYGIDNALPGTAAATPVSLHLNANGTTNVTLQQQALRIVLATTDGTHRRRILVWTTGRIHSQKWSSSDSAWKAD